MRKTIKGLHVLLLIAACTSIGYASGAVRPPEKAPPKIELPVVEAVVAAAPASTPGCEFVVTNHPLVIAEVITVDAFLPSGDEVIPSHLLVATKKDCGKFVEKYLGCERYYSCKTNWFKAVAIYNLALPNYYLRT